MQKCPDSRRLKYLPCLPPPPPPPLIFQPPRRESRRSAFPFAAAFPATALQGLDLSLPKQPPLKILRLAVEPYPYPYPPTKPYYPVSLYASLAPRTTPPPLVIFCDSGLDTLDVPSRPVLSVNIYHADTLAVHFCSRELGYCALLCI